MQHILWGLYSPETKAEQRHTEEKEKEKKKEGRVGGRAERLQAHFTQRYRWKYFKQNISFFKNKLYWLIDFGEGREREKERNIDLLLF